MNLGRSLPRDFLENGEALNFDQQGTVLKITLPAKPLNANGHGVQSVA